MKKIVGILAATFVAASMFAVDFAANVHGWTSLFTYDLAADDAKPQILGVRDPFDRQFAWSSTGIGVSFTGDKAGASFELNHRDVEVMSVKAWVQPIDALKITVGKLGLATNTETIDYTKLRAYEEADGAALEGWMLNIKPIDGLTIDAQFITGSARGSGWKFWGENGDFGQTTVKLGYAADFGSIFAMLDYTDPETEFTAGYSGNFDGVGVFADVAYATKANKIGADVFVNGSVDALGYKAYVKYNRELDKDEDADALLAKVFLSYGVDAGTLYCKATIPNAFQKDFPVQIYPGFQFNIGSASIDAGVQFNLNTDLDAGAGKGGEKSIIVPVIYKISL